MTLWHDVRAKTNRPPVPPDAFRSGSNWSGQETALDGSIDSHTPTRAKVAGRCSGDSTTTHHSGQREASVAGHHTGPARPVMEVRS